MRTTSGPPGTLLKPLIEVALVDEGIGADQEEQALARCPIETVRSLAILRGSGQISYFCATRSRTVFESRGDSAPEEGPGHVVRTWQLALSTILENLHCFLLAAEVPGVWPRNSPPLALVDMSVPGDDRPPVGGGQEKLQAVLKRLRPPGPNRFRRPPQALLTREAADGHPISLSKGCLTCVDRFRTEVLRQVGHT
jgi:hypothetical protein